MQWIAPSEKDAASDALEKQLWDAVAAGEEVSDEDFKTQLETLNEELKPSMPQQRNWKRRL